jgi:hypothetical protein
MEVATELCFLHESGNVLLVDWRTCKLLVYILVKSHIDRSPPPPNTCVRYIPVPNLSFMSFTLFSFYLNFFQNFPTMASAGIL